MPLLLKKKSSLNKHQDTSYIVTIYSFNICRICSTVKSSSPSSSFCSLFSVILGADPLDQQQKTSWPSRDSLVVSMDTSMLTTKKIRQIQKWGPAAQTN